MKPLHIYVDPRMELLSAVQLLAGDPNIDPFEGKYRDAMLAWFGKYDQHPAVLHYKSINKTFYYAAPVNSMRFMSNPYELELITEPSPYYFTAGGKENWMRFHQGLKDFALDTHFLDFWNSQQSYYESLIVKVKDILKNCDPVTELESYLRMGLDRYSFIFSPLQTCGYSDFKAEKKGEGSCTIGYNFEKYPERLEICFRVYLWHEFGHCLTMDMIEKYLIENPMSEEMLSKMASTFNLQVTDLYNGDFLYEGIIRGITYQLNVIYYGQEEAEAILGYDIEQGLPYAKNFVDAIQGFDSDKANISFEQYFPILMKEFMECFK